MMAGRTICTRFALILSLSLIHPIWAQADDTETAHLSAETVAAVLLREGPPSPKGPRRVWLPRAHPASRYRVLTPSEAMRMETVLHIFRDRPIEHFFEPDTDCNAYTVTELLLWLQVWPHAAAIAECVRTLEAQLGRLRGYPDPEPPDWPLFWENIATHLPGDRRLYAALYFWEQSSAPCLRKAAERYRRAFQARWSRMRLPTDATRTDTFVWPLPPVPEAWESCIFTEPDPLARRTPHLTSFLATPYPSRVRHVLPAECTGVQLVVNVVSGSRPARRHRQQICVGLRAVVKNDSYPLHLRLRALDLLVRQVGDYDTEFLRGLALDQKEDFATEVLSLAAVCALSRCRDKAALEVLADLVEVGPEWVAFQAASHLRYVAGLEVPPLVEMQDEGKPGVIDDPGDWIDVAHWLISTTKRHEVAERLREQIAELPKSWPWPYIDRLRPYLDHEHVNPRETERKDIPAVVLERSRGEDFFWKPIGDAKTSGG